MCVVAIMCASALAKAFPHFTIFNGDFCLCHCFLSARAFIKKLHRKSMLCATFFPHFALSLFISGVLVGPPYPSLYVCMCRCCDVILYSVYVVAAPGLLTLLFSCSVFSPSLSPDVCPVCFRQSSLPKTVKTMSFWYQSSSNSSRKKFTQLWFVLWKCVCSWFLI